MFAHAPLARSLLTLAGSTSGETSITGSDWKLLLLRARRSAPLQRADHIGLPELQGSMAPGDRR